MSPTPETGQGLRGEQKALQPEGERMWVLSGGPSSRGIRVLAESRSDGRQCQSKDCGRSWGTQSLGKALPGQLASITSSR